MAQARVRLRGARNALAAGDAAVAVSAAYYAMLYAARAALSEEDLSAKTHSGTWTLFRETFVHSQRFDPELVRRADRTLELRLGADYEAEPVSQSQADAATVLAERFVAAVEALYAD